MPKQKFTPGPYLVHEWGTKYQIVEAKVRTKIRPGITMMGQHILAKEIDKKANAILFAAAPEMYAALKLLLERMGAYQDAYPITFELPRVWAERAVAKVEAGNG